MLVAVPDPHPGQPDAGPRLSYRTRSDRGALEPGGCLRLSDIDVPPGDESHADVTLMWSAPRSGQQRLRDGRGLA
jgi:hypothetical protein